MDRPRNIPCKITVIWQKAFFTCLLSAFLVISLPGCSFLELMGRVADELLTDEGIGSAEEAGSSSEIDIRYTVDGTEEGHSSDEGVLMEESHEGASMDGNSTEIGAEGEQDEDSEDEADNLHSRMGGVVGYFAYESLSEAEQIWYMDIDRILYGMLEKVELSREPLSKGLDETHIDKIFQCVLNDRPEYFYVEGYAYKYYMQADKLLRIEFTGTYSMGIEEARSRRQRIDASAEQLLQGIDPSEGEYEKVKYVYETIIRNTDYDLNSEDNQNIYSVFVNRSSVCQGYAKATQYLLHLLGVECTMVMGNVNTGEGHAWNLVKVDGNYYYVDTTWGDASYQNDDDTGEEHFPAPPEINYDYLCVTTEQLLRTHILGGVVPMPQCVSMEANYYVREGVFFTSYDESQLTRAFDDARDNKRSDITLKSADIQTYVEINHALITEQKIFDFMDSPDGTVSYAQNEKQLSITFWMTNE